MSRAIRIGFLLTTVLFLFVSCRRSMGYGVVLWSTDEVLVPTGTVVSVHGKSERRGVYRLSNDGKHFELPKGRVKVFSSRRRALEYAQNFAPYIRNFVEVRQRRSLPLREKPDPNAEKIYNLPANRPAKVLSRSKNRVEIPPFKGYWYRVLTDDGTEGYVYGRYLSEFLLTDTGQAVYDEKDYFGDAAFESLFEEGITWRPTYFKEMVDGQFVVLELFDPKYGLFLLPEEKTVKIFTPDTPDAVYTYDKVMPTGPGRYFLYDVGVTLTVSDELTTVFYPYNNKIHRKDFVPMSTDLNQYIEAELERQQKQYQRFVDLGEGLTSNWGTIVFTGDNRFAVSPSTTAYDLGYFSAIDGRLGEMKFDIFVAGEMAKQYDGAVSLIFSNSGKSIPCLYSFTPDGVRLTMIHNVPAARVIRDEFAAGGLGEVVEYRN